MKASDQQHPWIDHFFLPYSDLLRNQEKTLDDRSEATNIDSQVLVSGKQPTLDLMSQSRN